MCGRYAMNAETDELIREFVAAGGDARDWNPSYSIAPTTTVPVVHEWPRSEDDEPERMVSLARWDFHPPSAPSRAPIINARIEKLTGRFWVGALSTRRVIVPMLGYYEWTGDKGDKTPHFIFGAGLLAAAGVALLTPEGGIEVAIVTREARDASGQVHDRMPAFLERELWDEWLDPASLTVKGDTAESGRRRDHAVEQLLATSERIASTIKTHVVDRKVNNARTADKRDPSLIESVGD